MTRPTVRRAFPSPENLSARFPVGFFFHPRRIFFSFFLQCAAWSEARSQRAGVVVTDNLT